MAVKEGHIFDILYLDIESLEKISRDFFQTFGGQKLIGKTFVTALEESPGMDLFEKLINECGYGKNVPGFFKALFSCINLKRKPIALNGFKIPILYLYELLEYSIPGHQLHTLKTIDQLEKKTFLKIENKSKVQQVMDMFPVRLSDHVIRQSIVSDGVAKQYLPFENELDPTGHVVTFDGHMKKGVVEQMYPNRVIFLLDMRCPVYCRFCFRKHKSTRKEKPPTLDDVKQANKYVKEHSSIKEILITGGEPLLNKPNLETAIKGLIKIDHVEVIRIATRAIAYFPQLFLKNNSAYIQYLIKKNNQAQDCGKRIEIGVHFVHPDEVSIQSLDIISQLNKNGIQVYLQTPFLNGLNTEGKTLAKLFTLLRQANVKIYYIFAPCHPIHGTMAYWTPVSKALEAVKYLRANVSDRCIPKLCTATSLGKIEWHSSGWAVERDEKDNNYTWIRTPYTLAYFKQFSADERKMPDLRVNNEGTLDAKFRLDMGDDKFLLGPRQKYTIGQEYKNTKENKTSKDNKSVSKLQESLDFEKQLKKIRSMMSSNFTNGFPIDNTCSKTILRTHKTRIEMLMDTIEDDLIYIKQNPDITDVRVHWNSLDYESLETLEQIVVKLKQIPHIVCIRLCCRHFTKTPDFFSQGVVERIARWCDFSIRNPIRIEIETWFLLPGEIEESHKKAARNLINRGVNIYANSLLIKEINDNASVIVNLCHRLRNAQIEFHHLYVAGHQIQKKLNGKLSMDSQQIIDIASMVRKECSGRQIPLYIVQTPRGEIDFSMIDF